LDIIENKKSYRKQIAIKHWKLHKYYLSYYIY
jgi:hypothetical protein